MSILRMPAVKAETGHSSHASIYNAIHAGLFTHPVQIGQRAVGWPSDEVHAINAARIAGMADDQIRELVIRLHAARCADFGEAFKPSWLERSAMRHRQASSKLSNTITDAAGTSAKRIGPVGKGQARV